MFVYADGVTQQGYKKSLKQEANVLILNNTDHTALPAGNGEPGITGKSAMTVYAGNAAERRKGNKMKVLKIVKATIYAFCKTLIFAKEYYSFLRNFFILEKFTKRE